MSSRYVNNDKRARRSPYSGQYKTKWAVLIGIDRYADGAYRPLRFAATDAVAMARSLIEHRGFLPQNVFLIVEPVPLNGALKSWLDSNEEHLGRCQQLATKLNIQELLFEILPSRVRADDCVLVYFAGHGVLREDSDDLRSTEPYLVPADAQSGRWSDHIDLHHLLKEGRHLTAKHVLYVLDACCSGLADQRSIEQAKPFIQKMMYRRARQCLTAGTREQRVDDGWRGQHSPFTGHLLSLLDGATTISDHEALCVSTVAAALKVAVASLATTSRQVPALFTAMGDRGGEFVFFPRIASLSLNDQATLARLLTDEVGRALNEPSPIGFAAKLWQRILHSAHATPGLRLEAQREHARAQLLLRNTRQALNELDTDALRTDADARMLCAIARLRLNEPEQAAAELEKVIELAPEHPYADWARCVVPIARRGRGRRHALLVGVNSIASIPGAELRGCANDAVAMRDLLSELGFTAMIILIGAEATIPAIRQAFQQFARDCQTEDSFVCYFSGQGILHREQPVYPSYDLLLTSNRLTDGDIDKAMRSIRAHDKLLITDGCHLAPAKDAVPDDYRFLHACQRDELSWEITDERGLHHGAFTWALENAVRTNRDVSVRQLMERIRDDLSNLQHPQRPGYIGSAASRLFEPRPIALEVIEVVEQSHWMFTNSQIRDFAGWLDNVEQLAANTGGAISMAPLRLAIGLAQLVRRDDQGALSTLRGSTSPSALLPLIWAQLLCNCFPEALDTWTRWRATHPELSPADLQHVLELDALLVACRVDARRALLVTVDDDNGAATELLRLARHAMIEQLGVPESNIFGMANSSKDAIASAFDAIINDAQDSPAFFLFIGPGFDGTEVWLSTIDAHGRASTDLAVSELCDRAAQCSHLTSALLITRSEPPAPSSRSDGQPQPGVREQVELGITTLVVAPQIHRDIADTPSNLNIEALIEILAKQGHAWFTLDNWREHFAGSHSARVRGKADAALLPYTAKRGRMLELIRYIQQGAPSPTLAFLERLTKQPDDAAEAWLQIAILQAQRGSYPDAITAIDESLARRRADESDQTKRALPTAAANGSSEIHYHRGRILLALGRHTEAEAALQLTVDAEPEHARAHYYRAVAIRALIERDLEKIRQESVRQYVKHGAPLGMDRVTADDIEQGMTAKRAHEPPHQERPAEAQWRTR
jgi:uncharacterized caspase-like protein